MAQRTQLKQEHILIKSRELNRTGALSRISRSRRALIPSMAAPSNGWRTASARSTAAAETGQGSRRFCRGPTNRRLPRADAGSDAAGSDSVSSSSEPMRAAEAEPAVDTSSRVIGASAHGLV